MPTIAANPYRGPTAVAGFGPPSAVAAVPIRPAVAVVTQGPQGPASPPTGFGLVRYAEAANQGPIAFDAGVRTQVVMVLDPTQTIDDLRGPFDAVTMWDGSTLQTPEVNDGLQVRFALSAIPLEAGGYLRLEAQIVSSGAILEAKDALMPSMAGAPVKVAFDLTLFSAAAFVASGVQFYLTSSVAVSIQSETLLIIPLTAGP